MKKKEVLALIGALILTITGTGCMNVAGEIPSDIGDSGVKVIVKNESDDSQKGNRVPSEEQTEAGQNGNNMVSLDPGVGGNAGKQGKIGSGEKMKKGNKGNGKVNEKGDLKGNTKVADSMDSVEEKDSMDGKDSEKLDSEYFSVEAEKGSEGVLNKEKARQASAEAVQKILEKIKVQRPKETEDFGVLYANDDSIPVYSGPGEEYRRALDNGQSAVIHKNCPITLIARTENGWLHISYISNGAPAYESAKQHIVEGYIPDGGVITEADYLAGLEYLANRNESVRNEVDELIAKKQKEKEQLEKERKAKELKEKEKIEKEQKEKERTEKEKEEKLQEEKEKADQEKVEKEQEETEKTEKEQTEEVQEEKEKATQENAETEQTEKEQTEQTNEVQEEKVTDIESEGEQNEE